MNTAAQLDIFSAPEPAAASITLRPYQVEAISSIKREFGTNRSTLLVLATGLGKTAVFSEIIRETPGRCLVIAHRDELIRQAVKRIQAQTGKSVDVEKADERAGAMSQVVVASVQTLTQDKRLTRFSPTEFRLVVADEAHHYLAPSFRKCLDYFTGAKLLGVTATPDRGDRKALGALFGEDPAFVMDILDGINGGFLSEIVAVTVRLDEIDLSDVRTTAGDLNQGDVDEKMAVEEVIHGVAQKTIEHAGDRPTLIFSTGINTAHRTAAAINGYRNGEVAAAIDSTMDDFRRRQILRDFQARKFQYLVNVDILTEGTDLPLVACVACARPTKVRSKYVQQVGRGTRLCEGKENLLIIDFAGNIGKHNLVQAVDIMAGKFGDEVTAKAKKIVEENPGRDVSEALAQAEDEIAQEKEEAKRRAAKAKKVKATSKFVDPFAVLNIPCPSDRWAGQFGVKLATEAQIALLEKKGIKPPMDCTVKQASALIDEVIRRSNAGLCTYPMARALKRAGFSGDVTFERAAQIMGALRRYEWRLPAAVREQLSQPEEQEPGWAG